MFVLPFMGTVSVWIGGSTNEDEVVASALPDDDQRQSPGGTGTIAMILQG